jgi:hypothetical protein
LPAIGGFSKGYPRIRQRTSLWKSTMLGPSAIVILAHFDLGERSRGSSPSKHINPSAADLMFIT